MNQIFVKDINPGSPAEAIKFFGQCGHPIPPHTNPADFYIQRLAIVPGYEEKCLPRAGKIIDAVCVVDSFYLRL